MHVTAIQNILAQIKILHKKFLAMVLAKIHLSQLPLQLVATQPIELIAGHLKVIPHQLHLLQLFYSSKTIPELIVTDLVGVICIHLFRLHQPLHPQLHHIFIQPLLHNPPESLIIDALQILQL
ncbi:uncharacterized protein ARMOST_06980 [Armillaria ostoyae]|uniref:Uncharacterized protein n=1 Tax=Armillaria ostoyae TaxID=47428 RepID=A0A284R4H9_ARMOS|nr:uncharacterized protein ARMOST_06980 [Armillaria ostoyae]